MGDHHDPELSDQVLGSEIELLADLIAAAGQCSCPMRQDQIDAALGVCAREDQSPSASR